MLAVELPLAGSPRFVNAEITNARRLYNDSAFVGAFDLEIDGVITLKENRLVQRHDGGFFIGGESLLDSLERSYVRFVTFLDPFATLATRAVRCEIAGALREQLGEVPLDSDFLELTLDEVLCPPALPERIGDTAQLLALENFRVGNLRDARATFDVVLRRLCVVRRVKLYGDERGARLVPPTSEGLKLRPIVFHRRIEREIVEKAFEIIGNTPPPQRTRRSA